MNPEADHPGASSDRWPELPYRAWRDTRWTLHLYLQIIGKVRLALAPPEPEWAHVPLYVTARGLNTSPLPHPNGVFDIDVDLIEHTVAVRAVTGAVERIPLEPMTVAAFYGKVMKALDRAGVPTRISTAPSEVPFTTPYPDDVEHRSYDRAWAGRYWRLLVETDAVLKEHRARFRGKASPVHLFWGSMDLAYTRYSGRLLEPPAGGGIIERATEDAEQACAGFWPGDERTMEPAFFAYVHPRPEGVEQAEVRPEAAAWRPDLGEFLLPYEAVRTAEDPRLALREFLESTFRAGAERAGWPRNLIVDPARPSP